MDFHEPVVKPRQKAIIIGGAAEGDGGFGDGLAAATGLILADARRALTDAARQTRKLGAAK